MSLRAGSSSWLARYRPRLIAHSFRRDRGNDRRAGQRGNDLAAIVIVVFVLIGACAWTAPQRLADLQIAPSGRSTGWSSEAPSSRSRSSRCAFSRPIDRVRAVHRAVRFFPSLSPRIEPAWPSFCATSSSRPRRPSRVRPFSHVVGLLERGQARPTRARPRSPTCIRSRSPASFMAPPPDYYAVLEYVPPMLVFQRVVTPASPAVWQRKIPGSSAQHHLARVRGRNQDSLQGAAASGRNDGC